MPVGVMLRSMTSMELTEWMAFYSVASKRTDQPSTAEALKAMFAHRVKKKE